ncbi:MAG: tRNA (uridine(34)/cytosine(34)/5-carboxymethylaminomethyluridine(34)-2'-O)-methyltransferase TrmL [Congregibacter sp.]
MRIALYEPEIPPNTGNIMRLCANTGCELHLIRPLGFSLDDKQLRRAGLDYHEFAEVAVHDNLEQMLAALHEPRVWTISTRGSRSYSDVRFKANDVLLFGPETRGLPQLLIDELGVQHCLRIPMQANSRSLNLSNAAALVLYEGLRQQGFPSIA